MDGTTAATIPIRDANGRMQAADPASGATDKTLVTANWISQTGDNGPNNLIHKFGNETKNGQLALQANTPLVTKQYGNAAAIFMQALSYDATDHPSTVYYPGIYMYDKNNVRIGGFYFLQNPSGATKIVARVLNANGTIREITIAEGQ